jgi:hypothetical protein
MDRDCEFLLRVRPKNDQDTIENTVMKCSLTGGVCFCESFPLMCTRRTWALAYEKRHGAPIKVEGR